MFDGPEYESYIALCRGLRLEREYEDGDPFIEPTDSAPDVYHGGWVGNDRWSSSELKSFKTDAVWLPRLDQLLSMLEEAGVTSAHWEKVPSGWYRLYPNPSRDEYGVVGNLPGRWVMTAAPTREEAAARLWMAVTGRTG